MRLPQGCRGVSGKDRNLLHMQRVPGVPGVDAFSKGYTFSHEIWHVVET